VEELEERKKEAKDDKDIELNVTLKTQETELARAKYVRAIFWYSKCHAS
jgi:hypothetical protein